MGRALMVCRCLSRLEVGKVEWGQTDDEGIDLSGFGVSEQDYW